MRNLSNKSKYEKYYEIFKKYKDKLEFVEANLLDSKIWNDIIKDQDYVIHVASPVFALTPKDQNKILNSAIDGTRNVLMGCVVNKIKKVVLTSSISAIRHCEKKS